MLLLIWVSPRHLLFPIAQVSSPSFFGPLFIVSARILTLLICFFAFSVVGSKVSNEKEATTGVETIDKRNRAKRAAKDELTPPKMKKLKVNLDVVHTYDTFVIHGRKLKRQTKKEGKLP